jgi:hypothetical protein
LEDVGIIVALCISVAVYYLFFLLYRDMNKGAQSPDAGQDNDKIFLEILKERELLSKFCVAQSFAAPFAIIRRNRSPEFIKSVLYVYYDKIAEFHSYVLFGEKNDPIKGYLRDSALKYFENLGAEKQKQFRTYSAEETNYEGIQRRNIHPLELLDFLAMHPVFDGVLRKKVDEKISTYANSLQQGRLDGAEAQLGDLLSDEVLYETFLLEGARSDG